MPNRPPVQAGTAPGRAPRRGGQGLRTKARSIGPGARRAELLHKAEQAEAAVHMAKWLRSPEPSEPTVKTPRCGDVTV
jgi:hypothetical protein